MYIHVQTHSQVSVPLTDNTLLVTGAGEFVYQPLLSAEAPVGWYEPPPPPLVSMVSIVLPVEAMTSAIRSMSLVCDE